MKRIYLHPLLFLLLPFLIPLKVSGINSKDTRMMAQPTLSANHIAFIYAEDLWIANTDGTEPRRLVRLTWHPGTDLVRGFTPDGKSILFISQQSSFTDR